MLIRTAQAIVIVFLLSSLYTIWFITGTPSITTNYVAVASEGLQPKAPESENAWPLYKQACQRFVRYEMPSPPPGEGTPTRCIWPDTDMDPASFPDYVQAALHRWIDQNRGAWQDYVAASRRPYCWYEYKELEDLLPHAKDQKTETTGSQAGIWANSMVNLLLPQLGTMRLLSTIGVWRARYASAQGHPQEAVDDALAIVGTGRDWQNPNGFLIEQLVGQRTNNYGCQEIRRLAGNKALRSTQLHQAQQQLEDLYKDGYPKLGIEAERLGLVDTVQRLFTDGGPGGGHPIPYQSQVFSKTATGDSKPTHSLAFWTAASLIHASRDQTLSIGNAFYDRAVEYWELSPYQHKGVPNPEKALKNLSIRYWLPKTLLPNLSHAGDLRYRARAEYQACIAVLALQRYRLDKGQYPPSLQTLVEDGYLRALPADPYSDGSLVYDRTGQTFTLYSVGPDFRDDGGVARPDKPGTKVKGGDWVFWPVPPLKPYPKETKPIRAAISH